ncbi:paramyosin-like isoform X2 [Heptranchias perlo]|uniref:paramyosin-like isoform X2 n=1 Tax=Heptranchias perlo TaxID=212740 RepID=UPI003559F6EA
MELPAVQDCIPKKSWGEIMDELDELGELDCDGAESLQAVNQSLISEEIRDLLLEYEKRYEAMLTKLEVTEQLESRLREKDAQISTLEQEIMQLNEMFEMQKSKNDLTKLEAVEQLENSLKEKDAEIATLEHEIAELSELAGTQRIKNKH